MARRNPPTCGDCGALIIWGHHGAKDAIGTRWFRLDPLGREPSECVRPIPFEDQPRHTCGGSHERWHRAWESAWAGIGRLACAELKVERLERRGE
jgi:hypothetical protein